MQDLVTQANCILHERCVGCSEWLAVLINSHGTSLFLSIKCKCLQWLLFKCGWKVKAHTYSLVWGLLVAISMLNLAWVSELGAFCGSCTGVSYSPSDGGYFMPPVDPWIGDAMTSWPGRCSKVWPQEVGQWCRTMKCSSCTRWATRMIKTWLGGWSISCAWRDWESCKFSLKKRYSRWDLICVYKHSGECKRDLSRLISVVHSDRTRGSKQKLKEEIIFEH